MMAKKGVLTTVMCLGLLACDSQSTDSGVDMITLDGVIQDALTSEGLAGVSICVVDEPETCQISSQSGTYSITISASRETELQAQIDGYVSAVIPVPAQVQSGDLRAVALLSSDLIEIQESLVGVETAEDRGALIFSVSNGIPGDGVNVENISVSLEPASGAGPFYTSSAGLPSQALDATSAHGGGLYTNLPADTYTLSLSGLPEDCFILFGWGAVDRLRTSIRPGHISVLRIECPQ